MRISLVLPFFLCLGFNVFAQEKIEVPLTASAGYSVFAPSFAACAPETEDSPFKLELKGIPKDLKNITRHQIRLDEKQFFYQHYLSKNISKEFFDQLMQFIKYEPDEKELSKEPLRSSVYIIVGEDEKGNRVWLADTNTDLDFSDEEVQPMLTYAESIDFETYKKIGEQAVQVKYQRVLDSEVVEKLVSIAVVWYPEKEQIYFNKPIHYTATLKSNQTAYEVAVANDGFLEEGLVEEKNSMVVVTDQMKGRVVDASVPVQPSQYFYLGEEVYQYLGLDANRRTANFRRVPDAATIKSAQVGFTAFDFQEKDFTTGQALSLGQFKGKYVLLDFWATWCPPCIKEFPNLKTLTARYDASKFEVLGIVGNSEASDLANLLDKFQVTWPQILSDDIVNQYDVKYYPTTLLISPEGKVLYKDLKGKELEEVLAGLIR